MPAPLQQEVALPQLAREGHFGLDTVGRVRVLAADEYHDVGLCNPVPCGACPFAVDGGG